MNKLLLSISLLSWLSFSIANGQDTKKPLFREVTLSYQKGHLIPHNESVKHMSGAPDVFQLDAYLNNVGKYDWHKFHNYPMVGISAGYQYFNSPQMASCSSLMLFLEPYFFETPKSRLTYRLGVGLGYVNTPFHPTKNPENQMVSEYFSVYLHGQLNYLFHITPYTRLVLSGYFAHLSNGGYSNPNHGANITGLGIGVNHLLDKNLNEPKRFVKPPKFEGPKPWKLNVDIKGGVTQPDDAVGTDLRYLVAGTDIYASKRISHRSALNFGAEVTHVAHRGASQGSLAALIGHDLIMGNLSMYFYLNLYLIQENKVNVAPFQVGGLRYRIGKFYLQNEVNFYNFNRADYTAFGIGYQL